VSLASLGRRFSIAGLGEVGVVLVSVVAKETEGEATTDAGGESAVVVVCSCWVEEREEAVAGLDEQGPLSGAVSECSAADGRGEGGVWGVEEGEGEGEGEDVEKEDGADDSVADSMDEVDVEVNGVDNDEDAGGGAVEDGDEEPPLEEEEGEVAADAELSASLREPNATDCAYDSNSTWSSRAFVSCGSCAVPIGFALDPRHSFRQ
jgi:hypothetical protein